MTVTTRLAVFDVDGTLVDSQHVILTAISAAFAALGHPPPRLEAVRRIIGLSLEEALVRLLPEEGDDRRIVAAQAYREVFKDQKAAANQRGPLFPGVSQVLSALDGAGWLLGIATGMSRRGLDAMLEAHGLRHWFVTLQTGDINPGKPHPGMVLRAMAEAGVAPNDAVMIGDTSYDMVMGRSAGVHTVGVAWGYHPPADLMKAGAQALVEDFAAVPSTLAAVLGRTDCVSQPS